MNAMTVTIGECRASYVTLLQPKPPFNAPNGEPKYSMTVLVPKTNTQAKAQIDAAIQAAIEAGVNSKWNGQRPPMPAICVHDGDGPRPSDGQPFGPECRGHWVFTASCKADRPPFVVDANVQKIINPAEIYSGMYCNVNVAFYAYNNSGKKGIGCGLNGVQKTRGRSVRRSAYGAGGPGLDGGPHHGTAGHALNGHGACINSGAGPMKGR